jgi:7-cyano-7-deazaguanine reductase
MEQKPKLNALGSATDYSYDGADSRLLEAFPNPFQASLMKGRIDISAPEFTSLCPITGQPDFATIRIEYIPDQLCVESKSLKLYLGSFRQHGMFHEACVEKICSDLQNLLRPKKIKVVGEFSPRGGISFWPTAQYPKPE